ncbi:MAG TPA: diaminopimelate decarboxylase [Terriglobales bacterium]|jgi:diaminopimelate decarboxylase
MTRTFVYQQGELSVGGVRLEALAQRFGTPLYVYDFDAVHTALDGYTRALGAAPHLICAAVKANGNLALLAQMAAWGSGFDVVSGGELERVLRAGARADRVVFSGVGKTAAEMDAALRAGILMFNVESEPELELLAARAARLRRPARYGIRVNPNIPAATHPHIATGLRQHKFGVEAATARRLYGAYRSRWLEPVGISCHIGSQILETAPFERAAERLARLALEVEAATGAHLRLVDVGGGLGISYQSGQRPPSLAAYAAAVRRGLRALFPRGGGRERRLIVEPGRRLVAAAGVLLTRVLYVKENASKRFVITDAGFNDLIRPSLYGAHHEIVPLRRRRGATAPADIVGPICESGDTFAHGRALAPVEAGDGLAILDAGAYGFVLSSNYNARPRPAEVAIAGGRARLIRQRETLDKMLQAELVGVRGGK